jgi:hypothetical protein
MHLSVSFPYERFFSKGGQKIYCHSLKKNESYDMTKEKEKQIQRNGLLFQNYITQSLRTGVNPKPRLPLNELLIMATIKYEVAVVVILWMRM